LIEACQEGLVKERLQRDLDPEGWHVLRTHFLHDSNMLVRTVWIVKTQIGAEIALVDIDLKSLDSFRYFEDVHKG
jgi:hypothetical protein